MPTLSSRLPRPCALLCPHEHGAGSLETQLTSHRNSLKTWMITQLQMETRCTCQPAWAAIAESIAWGVKNRLYFSALEARKSKIRVCGESPLASVPMAPSPLYPHRTSSTQQSVHICYLSCVCTSQSLQVGLHGSIFPWPLT